jgi:hypothetical protein
MQTVGRRRDHADATPLVHPERDIVAVASRRKQLARLERLLLQPKRYSELHAPAVVNG